ncbi:MAG: Inositol monophosphatase [Candidatus Amesbacteria bacterium GW2011_GWB1_47_26]|uniref:Inositol monophosphatase n=1 Tax=Candidatus Amesbacteria bacterium GW2011_GWC2_45_19 TaxID=1618366 RepID=A0A0G1M396_9BACT|nr:MAG: Inositol monophosphatase [Candidatus Amesbacteria bacterium GW2011_GWC2_45_19]KKU38106.1 MAG: Inositol monophosphatase [Candidatus Amesbacteria bacterium GW2011_GWA1_46_35]KKU69078.1 MAG: Inositol monophosphatase [Microgenomates group bacterium GW2011_GWC1_47_20]KKU74765.1 MAG: Inositol monophosphatase [Candidatus Amesbacteria bacterium GW2011_GWB1_47_26]KKU80196.1 MAG: Inositol monophosphatase [Candidatus Amesbacteria bacterium GW2011_GWA2_47_70]
MDQQILITAKIIMPSFLQTIDRYLLTIQYLGTKIKKGADSKSLVTKADLHIQTMFEQWVSENFTGQNVFGEENPPQSIGSDWIWYIDPIDGTTLFSRGIQEWGIIICLTYREVPILSWIYFPYIKSLYFSQKNQGSYKNGLKIHTSAVNAVKKAVVSGVYLNTLDREEIMLGKLWKDSLWGLIGRSLATDFCALAEGKIDIVVCYDCYSWEYKALSLLVEEAGGACCGFNKSKFKVSQTQPQSLIAFSNAKLMHTAIKLVRTPPPLTHSV